MVLHDDGHRDVSFAFFSGGLALAILFNYAPHLIGETALTLCTAVVLVLTIAFPMSPWLLGGACILYGVQFLVDERPHFVHTEFDFVLCVAVLATLAGTVAGPRSEWRARFVHAFAPIGVTIAGICLFAAGFSKLNIDWMEPAVSCGPVFYEWARTALPFSLLPTGDGVWYLVMVGTVVIELTAPLLLMHRRTRRAGVLLAFPLLYLLATNPSARLYEFTSPFLALFVLAFDVDAVASRAPKLRWSAWPWVALAVLGGSIVVALAVPDTVGGARHTKGLATRGFAMAWMLGVLLPIYVLAPLAAQPARRTLPLRFDVAWLVVAVLLARELTPYVGLRARGAFAMAANFKVTPLYSNHLVVGRPPQLPFNRVAALEASTDDKLNTGGHAIWPTWMVYDHLARHPEHSATILVDGVSETFEPHSADPRIRRSLWAWLFPVNRFSRRLHVTTCGHHGPKQFERLQLPRRRALRLQRWSPRR